MINFSIVICTYNPQPDVFARLLNALIRFSTDSPEHEVILVDNNSSPALVSNKSVKSFLALKKNAKLIFEEKPGLTAARLAGIKEAVHDWIIFFDDDNEPAVDYLQKAAAAIQLYPQTAAWGAAIVEVEYLGDVAYWLDSEKPLFQQRNELNTRFDNRPEWQPCYPFGTGLIIQKKVCKLYENRVAAKRYTLTDRKGKSLASGGDVQLVLTGIEQGFFAGIIAGLQIKHLIDESKATLAYLQKQQYGTASAYIKAYNQIFAQSPIPVTAVTNTEVFRTVYSLYRIYKKTTGNERFRLLLASKMGELNARVEAGGFAKPFLLRFYEKLIHA